MKTVYILTNNLSLYSDTGIFFSTLNESRNISDQDLLKSIPRSATITAYFDFDSAKKVLFQNRKMALVDDDDNRFNLKGLTYRSIKTPVIIEVQLKNDLIPNENETHRVINRELFDLKATAKVINCEKGYKGTMPTSLNIEGLDEISQCRIM